MIVAVTMVRDEADVIGAAVAHLLAEGVDLVLAVDHGSTDATSEILAGFGDRVAVRPDVSAGQDQDDRISELAETAVALGADWVLPFDADECWYAPDSTVGEALAACGHDVAVCRGWDHLVTGRDADGPTPFHRTVWRRPEQQRYPKVAFRARPGVRVRQGNHSADHPGRRGDGPLEYRHVQYRSLGHLARKVRQGAAANRDRPVSDAAHWRELAVLTDAELDVWWRDLCSTPGLVLDPIPIRG